MKKQVILPLVATLFLAGCAAHVPTGPSVMALPGSNKGFDEFDYDDYHCRDWALQRVGRKPAHAATDTAVADAAIGTVIGAAAGAAIGAAYGDPGIGAAVGSGVGLLGGAAVGAEHGREAGWEVQDRYDSAYIQCMYGKGHKVPVPETAQAESAPPPRTSRGHVPPPPRGNPPPPPRGNPPPPPRGSEW